MDLVKISYALEMKEDARREETRREQWPGGTTMIEHQLLSIQVFVEENRNGMTVCQLSVFNGWRIKETYSNYLDSGEELVDFELKLKQMAAPARLGC